MTFTILPWGCFSHSWHVLSAWAWWHRGWRGSWERSTRGWHGRDTGTHGRRCLGRSISTMRQGIRLWKSVHQLWSNKPWAPGWRFTWHKSGGQNPCNRVTFYTQGLNVLMFSFLSFCFDCLFLCLAARCRHHLPHDIPCTAHPWSWSLQVLRISPLPKGTSGCTRGIRGTSGCTGCTRHRCLARHFLNLFYKHKIPTNKTSTNSSNDCWKLLASIVLALTTNASMKKWIKFVIWGNYHFSLLLPRTWCMPALKIPRSQNMYILLQLCKNHDLKTKKGPCNPAIGIGAGCTDAVLSAHASASGLSLSFLLQVGLRQFHHATLSRWSKW